MSLWFAPTRGLPGAVLVAACFLAPVQARGQSSADSAQISGTVATASGSPVADARVFLRSSKDNDNTDQKQTTTDRQGRYSFSGLLFGEYQISAAAPGFRDSKIKTVFLNSPLLTADLTLSPLLSTSADSGISGGPQKAPPSFTASGARGTIAPSGYSTGLRSEEAANFSASTNAITLTLFPSFAAGAADCGQEPVLLHAAETAPRSFAANHALGAFYLGHAHYAKAIPYLDAARSLAPGEFGNSRDLALALLGAGRGSDAAALLRQLRVERPDDSTLMRLLAVAYRATGEKEKSVAAFLKAASVDAAADNQYDCGLGLIQMGSIAQARDLLATATKSHTDSARLSLGLAIAENLLGHQQEAVSALLHSSDSDRDFLPPLALLAEISALPDQANLDLRRRIAAYLVTHPKDADAHLAYALALRKQSQLRQREDSHQEIAMQLNRALQLNPRSARAHFLLGDVESEANNLSVAIDEFVAALKLEPANAQAHYRLSLLYRRTGQLEAAAREMDVFRSLSGKPGEEGPPAPSLTPPSFQLIPAQRSCDANP